jgi:hypothetical protein
MRRIAKTAAASAEKKNTLYCPSIVKIQSQRIKTISDI